VSTDNRYVLICRVGLLHLRDEARRTDNVKCSDTEQALGVVDALGLEYFGADGYSGVYL
jgi:hypothetical protein